jgi:hypothetical protein
MFDAVVQGGKQEVFRVYYDDEYAHAWVIVRGIHNGNWNRSVRFSSKKSPNFIYNVSQREIFYSFGEAKRCMLQELGRELQEVEDTVQRARDLRPEDV